jgi:hypothetical protein
MIVVRSGFEVPKRACGYNGRNFKSTALGNDFGAAAQRCQENKFGRGKSRYNDGAVAGRLGQWIFR